MKNVVYSSNVRGDEGKKKVGDGQMEDGEEQWSLARHRMSVQIKEGSESEKYRPILFTKASD
jgi:hypothetical protein